MISSTKQLVKDFMRSDILVTAKPQESIMEAVKKMAKYNVGSVVVTDEEDKVIGILTERDLVRLVATSYDLNSPIEKAMTKNPKTIRYDEYVQKAIITMRENNIRHLPVVNKEGKLVGMISLKDISKLISYESFE